MNLDLVRKQLDIYDNIIKNMLTLRMSLIPLVAEIKMENNFPLHQSKREDEIYHNIEIFSKENGIDKDLVKNIYKLMISNALKIEEEFVNNPNDTILNKKTDYSNSESIKEYFQKLDKILSNDIPDIISHIVKSDELANLSLTQKATLYYSNKINNN